MRKKEEKRPFFTVGNLVAAIVAFLVFLVVGLGGYYWSAGEFVSAQLAVVYVILALIGAVALLFKLRRFAVLYYIGCAAGWGVGWFVGGLKGEFAPTAGTICTFFFIAVFAVFGVIAEYKRFRKYFRKRAEEKAAKQTEEESAKALEAMETESAAPAAEAGTVEKETAPQPESPVEAPGAEASVSARDGTDSSDDL